MSDEHTPTHGAPGSHEASGNPRTPSTPISFGMALLRYALPAVVVLAGIVVMSLGSESEVEGGAGIAGAGLAIFAMNWLIRAAGDGDREREREEQAREYFTAHGRWPDEAPRREQRSDEPGSPAPATSTPAPAATRRRLERPSRSRTRGSQHS